MLEINSLYSHVLVTGSTGLVGSHVVDNLLRRGIKVRAVARSKAKADLFSASRAKFASLLEFLFIDDLTTPGVFNDAVVGVDGIIHIASVSLRGISGFISSGHSMLTVQLQLISP